VKVNFYYYPNIDLFFLAQDLGYNVEAAAALPKLAKANPGQ
jgi:hypothetical protein